MELKFSTYHREGKNQARKTSIRISQVLLLEWHMIYFFKRESYGNINQTAYGILASTIYNGTSKFYFLTPK
jgi:hypothetical protein